MAATWKGYISFGLVSLPVSLSPAARTERISFNQLHTVCHTRLKQPLFCPTCDRMVERSEVEKGYEYEKDQYLLFTAEELDSVEPDSARAMDILEFVKLDEIDPVYFDSSYYVSPEEGGSHAYYLLASAMKNAGYAGIAKLTMHSRESIVIIRPSARGLTLHTMFYSNEVRSHSAGDDSAENKEQEMSLAMQLIQTLAAPFKPEKYRDAYQEGLQKLIEAKAHNQNIPAIQHHTIMPVVDLMAALKESLSKPAAAPTQSKSLLHAVPTPKKETGRKKKAS